MKKILILLIPVLFPIFSHAWTGSPSENLLNPIPASEFSCNLPAPANLVVSNISAHSATGTWSAVPGAIGYAVEVRLTSNNSLVYSNTTAALTEIATGLPAGEDLDYIVAAICPNEEISTQTASKGFTTDVVIEIVAVGYGTPCEGHYTEEATIFYNVPEDDTFEGEIINGQEYWLEISQTGRTVNPVSFYKINYDEAGLTDYICDFQEFYVEQYTPLGNPTGVNEEESNNPQNLFDKIQIYNLNQGGTFLDIKLVGNNSNLASFGYIQVKATGLGWDDANGAYDIKLRSCTSGSGDDGRNREADNGKLPENAKLNAEINVFPNPVQSMLNIEFSEESEVQEDIHIEMIDVNGKIMLANQFNALSRIAKMDVSGIQTGVYFLKIETGKDVRMLKVIKTK